MKQSWMLLSRAARQMNTYFSGLAVYCEVQHGGEVCTPELPPELTFHSRHNELRNESSLGREQLRKAFHKKETEENERNRRDRRKRVNREGVQSQKRSGTNGNEFVGRRIDEKEAS